MKTLVAATVAVLLGAAPRTFAQAPGFTLQSENDAYPSWGDDDYTNGLRVSLDFGKAVMWGRLFDVPPCSDPARAMGTRCARTTIMLGQNFYSPHTITISGVQEDERPYSAWLYVGLAGRIVEGSRMRSVELQVGTTGKAALGKEVQTWWHSRSFIHAPEPKGWAHQVKPVPGLVGIVGSWEDRLAVQRETGGASPFVFADATPYYGVTVGNVHDFVSAGATVRLGYNLQNRWVDKIGPTLQIASASPSPTLVAEGPVRHFEFNVFGSAEARGVAWNALLQHDTYTPRHLASIARGVVDYEAGVAAGYRRVSGGFRWVWRSPEFDGGRWSRFAGIFFTIGPG